MNKKYKIKNSHTREFDMNNEDDNYLYSYRTTDYIYENADCKYYERHDCTLISSCPSKKRAIYIAGINRRISTAFGNPRINTGITKISVWPHTKK